MNSTLTERLNQILPRITDPAFLKSEGIGNEIACHIFDYPAAQELEVRDHIERLTNQLDSRYRDLKVLHLNLLDVAVSYLQSRKLLDKAVAMHAKKGDTGVIKALKGPFAAEKVRDFIAQNHQPADYDIVILSGVGSIWPLLRAHSLLNAMHSIMGSTPLVLFYPGTFDGTTLKLFGQLSTQSQPDKRNYYRAFSLIPQKVSL